MNDLTVKGTTTELQQAQQITQAMYDSFLDYINVESEKTQETYTKAIRQWFKYMVDNGITRPTKNDVQAYKNWLKTSPIEEGPHKGKKRTAATVQNYIMAVKIFFNWAEGEKLYPNVAKRVKGEKLGKEHKKDYLTKRQVKKVMETAKGNSVTELRDYAILALMFTGGLRTIEVSRALVGDMKPRGEDMVLYIQGKGHSEKEDYVKLMSNVEDAIRAYLKARGNEDPEGPLFTSTSNRSKGKALSTRSVSKIVKEAMKKAGYDSERLTAHSTRHTAVTLALLGGEDLERVQQFARHKDPATTLIYAHSLERETNTCEQTIAKAIF